VVEGGAFDRAIAVQDEGQGRVSTVLDAGWSTPVGLNGGYIAAVVLRAIIEAVGRPERNPRSFTLHYLSAPQAGPATVEVTEERSGRTLTSVSARLVQDGRTRVLALAALAAPYSQEIAFGDPAPALAPFTAIDPIAQAPPGFPIVEFFDLRPSLGPLPFVQPPADEALTGGWIRLREDRPLDAPLLALYADAWWPALFVRTPLPVGVPTIDLTVHFRAPEVLAALEPGTPLMVRFTTRTARDGFFEEDGELWAPDGTLLAHSRQLAILPARP
jgi:acyl-CoA thioesterase